MSGDDLAQEIRAILAPLLARAGEKAGLLAQELGLSVKAEGLARTVARAEAAFGAARVRAGAQALIARLRAERGGSDPIP